MLDLCLLPVVISVVSSSDSMAFQPAELNEFLSSRSYIEGYVPSQADIAVLEHLRGVSVDTSLCHLLRWQRHINSYSAEDRLAFPGIKKVYYW